MVDYDILTIYHIAGGGKKHRKLIHKDIYQWLREYKYPKGYRVLCMNYQFVSERNKNKTKTLTGDNNGDH